MNTPSVDVIVSILGNEESYYESGKKVGIKYPTLTKDQVRQIIDNLYVSFTDRVESDFFTGFNAGKEKAFRDNRDMCKVGEKLFANEKEANEYIEQLIKELSQ